jgi:hypothetical protein
MTNSKTLECRTCEKEVSKNAKICPHCGEENPANKTSAFTWTVAVVGVLWMIGHFGSSGSTNKPRMPDAIDASIACKDFIGQRLKSPSSAKFPMVASKARALGTNKYLLDSYVDSQNGFGALIRTDFKCIVYYNPENNMWELMQLNIN